MYLPLVFCLLMLSPGGVRGAFVHEDRMLVAGMLSFLQVGHGAASVGKKCFAPPGLKREQAAPVSICMMTGRGRLCKGASGKE
jgi:hypothetical protein